MDIFSTIAIISCFATPIFFLSTVGFIYLYVKNRLESGKEKKKLETRIVTISRTGLNAVRESWFAEIQNATYASELEVETKYIYPMMRFLGYGLQDIRMRVEAIVRVGRADVRGIADWVVYKDSHPMIVVEAKAVQQGLDVNVQEQARSYCFALNVPMYLLTNGREIKLYKRGVGFDELVFRATTAELPGKWGELYGLIGVSN